MNKQDEKNPDILNELQLWICDQMEKIIKVPKDKNNINELKMKFAIFSDVYKFSENYEENVKILNQEVAQNKWKTKKQIEKIKEVNEIEDEILKWKDISKIETPEELDKIWDVYKFLDDYKNNANILNKNIRSKKFQLER